MKNMNIFTKQNKQEKLNKQEEDEENIANLQKMLSAVSTAWTPSDISYYGPNSRSIAFWGPVSYQSSLPIISQILELNDIDSSLPIKLTINTEGGSLTDAFAIYDMLRTVEAPIITIAMGMCASAGLALLSAGDLRLACPSTIFFYHQTILDAPTFTSLEASSATSQAYEMCHRLYDRTLIERTGMSKEDWVGNFKNRTVKYFNAEEALKYGFIDNILDYPQKDVSFVQREK